MQTLNRYHENITKTCLSQKKIMFVATTHNFGATKNVFCRDKTFVVTKMILVAAPTNDTRKAWTLKY